MAKTVHTYHLVPGSQSHVSPQKSSARDNQPAPRRYGHHPRRRLRRLVAATVALLARGIRDTALQHREQDPLHTELAFINEHLGEKITVKRICEISGRSPSTLNRLFLAAYGKSPIDYLIERRLDQAEILCATTNDRLSAIASRCGFADANHLIRTFHRHGRKRAYA